LTPFGGAPNDEQSAHQEQHKQEEGAAGGKPQLCPLQAYCCLVIEVAFALVGGGVVVFRGDQFLQVENK
jgi:hypothetical protein